MNKKKIAKRRAILSIDTAQREKTLVQIEIDNQLYQIVIDSSEQKSQVVLSQIDKLLREHNLSLSDIVEVSVNTGPGSFTGLRVGVAVANTLGFLLDVPVNGSRKPVEPKYS